MFTAGGTGGGPGSGSFNLELAQFQQQVANAYQACRACNGDSCKAKKFYGAANNQLAVPAVPDCCAAANLDLSTCTTTCSECDRCGGQCRYVSSGTGSVSSATAPRSLKKKASSKKSHSKKV